MKPWNYLLLFSLPVLVITGRILGEWWNFLLPVSCFVLYPAANLLLPPPGDHTQIRPGKASFMYDAIAWGFVPTLLLLTAWCVYDAGTHTITPLSFTGLFISVGIMNGVLGFTIAHEFIHRFQKRYRLGANLLLLQNNYMHYGVEHVWGHHVYACTPDDPHTATVNESLYTFLPRAIRATYGNAWKIEAKRLARRSRRILDIRNRMLGFGALQGLFMLTILVFIGAQSLLFFLLQNIVAIVLLHITNYTQHYGLMRKMDEKGVYEKLKDHHAWSTDRSDKAVDLFHLENHADHHMHPNLSFEKLTPKDGSPRHPSGYAFMILLSLLPPLWFRTMNRRIPSHLLNTQL